MAYIHVALHLREMTPPAIRVQNGRTFIDRMTDNVNFEAPNPLPNPTLVFYAGICDDLEGAIKASGKGKLSTEDLHKAIEEFDLNTIILGIYVEGIANAPGNTEEDARKIILSAGMTISEQGAPITEMEKPENFRLDFGANDGEIHAFVYAIHGAKSYLLEISRDGINFGALKPLIFPSTRNMIVTGLISGTMYYLRIRAIGSHTKSPVSNVIKQRAR